MSVLVIVLAIGLVARITRFVTVDRLAGVIRATAMRLFGYDSELYYLIGCAWCLSIWVGGGVFTVAWFYGHTAAFMIVAAAATASYIVGMLQTWFDPAAAKPGV